MKDYDVVPVRVIEDDAKPCEWELSPFGEVGGEPNTKTWLNFITDFGYKYCPQCGRSLEERWSIDMKNIKIPFSPKKIDDIVKQFLTTESDLIGSSSITQEQADLLVEWYKIKLLQSIANGYSNPEDKLNPEK